MEILNKSMYSSSIVIITNRGAWSDESQRSGWMKWLLTSVDLLHKNMRSITKFALVLESKYLVGTWLIGSKSSRLNKSAIVKRSLLKVEWWGKDGSQILSLILKSPVIIKRFKILTSVSLRYFKVVWNESE